MPIHIETWEHAQLFVKEHALLVQKVCNLMLIEATNRSVPIHEIIIRPAQTPEHLGSIVIDMTVIGDSETRFRLWDSICERLAELEVKSTFSDNDQRVLLENIFTCINRIERE